MNLAFPLLALRRAHILIKESRYMTYIQNIFYKMSYVDNKNIDGNVISI